MNNFNKEEFAKIIMKIYLKYRNQRDFAKKSTISRTYLSQYMNMKLEEPPKPGILKKLAQASKGVATYQELMNVCGYLEEYECVLSSNDSKLEQILYLANGLNVKETNYLIDVLSKSKIYIEEENK